MAGGTFNKRAGKVRPGTYINFESTRQDTVNGGSRGIVAIPLTKATYGPAKQWITLTAASPDSAFAQLGYSIYDEDENRQMLLIREAFKRASQVLVYIDKDKRRGRICHGDYYGNSKVRRHKRKFIVFRNRRKSG